MASDGKAPTPEQLAVGARSLIDIGRIIYRTVREAGPLGAPESFFYMALAEGGLPDSVTTEIIDALVAGGLVERRNHALVAVRN